MFWICTSLLGFVTLVIFSLSAIISECRTQLTINLISWKLTTLENMMLCQTQECVWQRSVLVHMKDANVARIATQVAEFYSATIENGLQRLLTQFQGLGGPLQGQETVLPGGSANEEG
ncbi:hypothetical protein DL89DRAFT_300220 [Linderina pennispora]|uniref:BRO1 domain-containing protein n=1 Tax=Linderina pennispora TaxID=61395 RepID=A0A1Y1WLR8_9FUNG|nr:uncharacterized protein DL89DRAFT_300220 [Linderina pennispora]ORX74248.1 hypothetical protein DL89DRAFT_300220 [Linderina pennispora]